MNEKTYTITERELTSDLTEWVVVVDGYGLTHGLTLEIAIKNLDEYVYE
jgi:hypothetical protein